MGCGCRCRPWVQGEHLRVSPWKRQQHSRTGQPPLFTDGETEASAGTVGFLGFAPTTSFSPCVDRVGGAGGPSWLSRRGCLGGRARLAESASPATFSGVAWSPSKCDLLTKQPVLCTALREVGGEVWRENHQLSSHPLEPQFPHL